MITVSDVSLKFSEKPLFKDVNLKFIKGNCYGIIGANGAGKSTFLKILSGEQEHDAGEISMTPGERMAKLVQDHFAFDSYSVKETVMIGYPKLYKISKEKDAIYEKPDFSDYEDFLESRCFPRSRDKMKLMLKQFDIPFYDPFLIIEKTEGRLEGDDFHIVIER